MISLVVLQNGTGCDEDETCSCSEPCVTCAIEGCEEILDRRRSRKKKKCGSRSNSSRRNSSSNSSTISSSSNIVAVTEEV
jgi:hypothetical protein